MLLAQGFGTPIIFIVPVFIAIIVAMTTGIYFLIRWLGAPKNDLKRIWFCGLLACWIFYQTVFPNYVSSDAVTGAASTGVPSSRLIERIGPPHSISEISNSKTMWYYNTGYFASRTIGVTIDRSDGRVVDWFVQ